MFNNYFSRWSRLAQIILWQQTFYSKTVQRPCRLKFWFQFQVSTAVSELTLSVYNLIIYYNLSDNGMNKLRFVLTVRSAIEIRILWRRPMPPTTSPRRIIDRGSFVLSEKSRWGLRKVLKKIILLCVSESNLTAPFAQQNSTFKLFVWNSSLKR